MIKKIFLSLILLLIVFLCAGAGALYYAVVLEPGEEIKADNIGSILGKESPVYYSDGVTRLGVFFDEAHRQYVPYDAIPVNFINALVASEDNTFFSHIGFDIAGIVRAAIKNIQSGRIVQGGSTLTQQTAKNLFKRRTRSIQAKLKELLFALRLEYHYSKEKIFEFYANQFYVSGNGHGLGVAARYYFDKKPEELTLLQCAYIAGSVKRPNYYNPFIKKSEESRKKALEHGRTRVNYVLDKMLELGMISEYQHSVALLGDIGFEQGRVGFPLDYAMDMVKDAVASPEIVQALEKHDISNISTSGVRIITTIDERLQNQTLYSLRHDLSRLDVRLRGYEREEVQQELAGLDYQGDVEPEKGAYRRGVIKAVAQTGEGREIIVDLGRGFGRGIIDRDGVKRLVEARVKFLKNPWTEAGKADYASFYEQLQAGDEVWTSLRGRDENGRLLLDLEKFPQVNGGALVLRDGVLKAVAGGVENRFYNRAIYARRTMGSSFKPFVYAAALQLGWNSTDLLRNARNVFVFQNQAYFPRPDHHSPFNEVSMSWAGVKSENVASVWLLYHLCDRLDSAQFAEVAARVDMLPRTVDGEEEPYRRYRSRIRDQLGIVMTPEVLRQAAYRLARKNIEADLIFAGRDLDFDRFQRLPYGLGFDTFLAEVENELAAGSLRPGEREELQLRRGILSRSYLQLEQLRDQFERYRQAADARFGAAAMPGSATAALGLSPGAERARLVYDGFAERYCYIGENSRRGGLVPVSSGRLREVLANLDERGRARFWQDVYLDCEVSVESFDILRQQVARELERLAEQPPYSPAVLEQVSDFRVLVGLRYLIALARELGIDSELEPVLSFPLGSNVVSLLETARVYSGLATGTVVRLGGGENDSNDLLSIIDRIESDDGEVLYRPAREKVRLLAPETTLAVGHILENVVKFGTGRYADTHIKLTDAGQADDRLGDLDLSIPVLGKTGTANRYTNAAFFGFLPWFAADGSGLFLDDGYVVGVYVGFDDNKPMRRGATRITGSGGALPAWSEIVSAVAARERYAEHLDIVDLSFSGLPLLRPDIGQKLIAVLPDHGGVVGDNAATVTPENRYTPSILTFGSIDENRRFLPERSFQPFWRVGGGPETAPQ